MGADPQKPIRHRIAVGITYAAADKGIPEARSARHYETPLQLS
jgi:hypothetical protein